MEAIQWLQNAKTATEIQQAAEFFTLITEENKQLKEQLRKLNLSDMSKEQSSINYYNLYKELKAENAELYKALETKELTTAEKLLWLVENNLERYPLIDEQGNAYVGGVLFIHLATNEYGKDRCIEYTDILQLHEAIVTLYEWAKEKQSVSNRI